MPQVPLNFSDSERNFGDLPAALLKNRFFEQTPTQAGGDVLLARPGNAPIGTHGTGPQRAFFSLPGLFGGALFFVSGDSLFRREPDGTTFQITGVIYGTGSVSFCGVEGLDYERLLIADGARLQMYDGGTQATATLTASGRPTNGDMIDVNGTYYQWVDPDTAGSVATGSGTAINPWKVARGASLAADLGNMIGAINFVGTPGTTWSSNLGGQNGDVTAADLDTAATTIVITSRIDTVAANLYTTTVTSSDTVPNISWGSGLMAGGGVHGLNGVAVPDGLPPVSVTTLKSYVIVSIARTDRFYYIKPAEVTINALDFYTSESHPDNTLICTTVGDTVWLIGEASTEIWYTTGDADDPFAPVNGRVYDRGAIDGTVVNIKGVLYLVGPDYVVYSIGGQPNRVSNHGVEELIRLTIGAE